MQPAFLLLCDSGISPLNARPAILLPGVFHRRAVAPELRRVDDGAISDALDDHVGVGSSKPKRTYACNDRALCWQLDAVSARERNRETIELVLDLRVGLGVVQVAW